jgi:hypothetical protein
MEQALREASAELRTVKASVQSEVLQQIQNPLHRQLVRHIEATEEFLKVMKEQHAAVFEEMNRLAAQSARASIAASELESQRAQMEKTDSKASKEKGQDNRR